jgi:hypothetical protein
MTKNGCSESARLFWQHYSLSLERAVHGMSLDRTHELVLAGFEKQRGVELPQLKDELALLQVAATADAKKNRAHYDSIKHLKQRIREIENNDDEHAYLLEFGSWLFGGDQAGTAAPQTPKPRSRAAVTPKVEMNTKSLLCTLRLESGVLARVSVWSTAANLCEVVLSKITGIDAEGAYESIEINNQVLEPGMVLWDIKGIKLAPPPSARSTVSKADINSLRFKLKEARRTWTLPIFDGREDDGSALAGNMIELHDWCTERDITRILRRSNDVEDAFFLEPGKVRVRTTLGDAVDTVGRIPHRIVRVDRIVSRRRKSKPPVAAKGGTLEGFIKRKRGEQRHEVFMEYIDMLARLKIGGGTKSVGGGPRKRKNTWDDNSLVPDFVPATSGTVKRTRTEIHGRAGANRGVDGIEDETPVVGESQIDGVKTNEGICIKCGSEMTYVRAEASLVCNGYDEECVDCEGNIEVIHRQCGYSVDALDNSPSSLPFGTKMQYTHSSYKRIVRDPILFFWLSCFVD